MSETETPATIKVVSKDGYEMEIVRGTTPQFEFKPGDIVHFSKSLRNGKVALIRGVGDGLLWFSVFPTVAEAIKPEALAAPVESSSCRVKAEYIRQYGWAVDDLTNPSA